MFKTERQFIIGHRAVSETKTPGYCPLEEKEEDGVYLVDGAGMNDANVKNEFTNQTAI